MPRKPVVSVNQGENQAASPVGDLIGALLGGQSPAQPASTPKPTSKPKPKPSSKPKPKPSSQDQGGLDMGSLLGGLLGGGSGGASNTSSGGLDIGSLLGGLLGGGQSSAAASTSSNSPLAPIIDALAKKLGISPQIASVVVSLVLSKMAAGQTGSRGVGINLDELAGNMGASTGMVEELVQQTGLDHETASRSLTTALNMMGSQASSDVTAARKPARRSSRKT
jgi:hypothetical protein